MLHTDKKKKGADSYWSISNPFRSKGGSKNDEDFVPLGLKELDLARGTKGKYGEAIRTILGGDPEHVFRERARTRSQVSVNPLAASAVFGGGGVSFAANTADEGGRQDMLNSLSFLKTLTLKARAGTLNPEEQKFLLQQARFGSDLGKFQRLVGRREEVVKQREAVEAFRRRAPGRSQTILTRRES